MMKNTFLVTLLLLLFSANTFAQDPTGDCDCDYNTDELICVSFFGVIEQVHPCDIECGLFIEIEMFEEITIVDCDDLVFGCTDPSALNYNEEATANDGSCEYDNSGNCDCDWSTDELVCVDFGGGEIAQLHPCDLECYEWFLGLEIVDCEDLVYGCTDSSALNYDPEATANDGSCVYEQEEECDCDWDTAEVICVSFFGEIMEVHPCELECSNLLGLGGEFEVEIVDCGDIVYGCTDPSALNYNPEATANDGSCEYEQEEECDCNWDTAEVICVSIYGEIYEVHPCEIECGYFEELLEEGFEVELVDCGDIVYGCTDPSALNYNADATANDGSCEYEQEEECDCNWDTAEVICVSIYGEIYEVHPCEIECGYYEEFLGEGFEIEIVDCEDLVYGCTDPSALNYNEEANVNDGSCEYEECDCDWETDEIICVSFDGQVVEVHPCLMECEFEEGLFENIEIVDCGTIVYGCTDPLALNYDSEATANDGSCEYEIIDECDCDWTTDEWLCVVILDENLGNEFYITVHQCDLDCGLVDLDEFGLEYEIIDCETDEGTDEEEEEDENSDWTDNYDFDFDQFVEDQAELTELIEEIISSGDFDDITDLEDLLITLTLFPNPLEGTDLGLNVESSEDLTAEIIIINSLGQKVYEDEKELTAGQNRLELNLDELEAGVYFTRVITSNGTLVQEKFIKQ